ncbi:hypothetical protein EDD75_0307 [Thermodesulfitimonas autotrophica]|uniref:Uncharacterized protein n=1 Tax=Thermodesulfitimonas autotrophica TaxID=1894989 RepID=A0A3N5C029_9THEO|nr:hypothetical protein [Thermodesulfitimonas autotrophica]RPF49491.1 hypothetical protein EDD75_0307 [Thermodesulfitimonas autotrophica]
MGRRGPARAARMILKNETGFDLRIRVTNPDLPEELEDTTLRPGEEVSLFLLEDGDNSGEGADVVTITAVPKVVYIRVRPKNPEADDLGWAVVVNGRFIATDSPYEAGPCCEEIAQDVAIALGCGYRERVVTVQSDDWNWDDDVLPQVTQERNASVGGLFVTYTLRFGLDEAIGHAAVELKPRETPEDAVHRYFRGFFFDGTRCEKKAREYWAPDESAVLTIETWHAVPPGEFAVLKKYLGF